MASRDLHLDLLAGALVVVGGTNLLSFFNKEGMLPSMFCSDECREFFEDFVAEYCFADHGSNPIFLKKGA